MADGWLPSAIGIALSVGNIAAIAAQVPAGLLVDAVPYKRLVTAAGIATITLALSHSEKLGGRLGGNLRFKALGSMLAAVLMGYIGTHLGAGAVFSVAALFGGLALVCLLMISGIDIDNAPHRTEHPTALPKHARTAPLCRSRELWHDPRLLAFAGCVFLFQLGNAALLPFAVV
ncbi:MAG: MFS transporter, partial [Pseudomonadota bacterium]|nr:MFS transporter [Pseudomonadota bacterium]